MSDAADRLARSRQAILEHIARRERRHDPREVGPGAERAANGAQARAAYASAPHAATPEAGAPAWAYDEAPLPAGRGWLGRAQRATAMWWRHHPASMAVEIVEPLLREYAARKPAQFLGIAAATGAAITFARPWKLISITTLLVAVVKASNLPGIVMSAMAAADYEHDQQDGPPT